MNRLVGPLAGLLLFWWIVFYIVAGALNLGDVWSLNTLLLYLLRISVILAAMALAFFTLLWLVPRLDARGTAALLRPRARFEAYTSLGDLPSMPVSALPKQAPQPQDDGWVPSDLRAWWAAYSKAHPAHARAFVQAWCIMAANPVPASPYANGHGGATLIEHSWNVVRTLSRIKPWPTYTGMKNQKGVVIYHLTNAKREPYSFKRSDPLPWLCAFAHDIGKVICYQVDGDLVKQVRDEHDSEGAALLRSLESWRALDFKELQRALVCIGWYHKTSSVPRAPWIDDRTRALLMLISQVDAFAGKKEGEGAFRLFIANPVDSSVVSSHAVGLQADTVAQAGVEPEAAPESDAQTGSAAPYIQPIPEYANESIDALAPEPGTQPTCAPSPAQVQQAQESPNAEATSAEPAKKTTMYPEAYERELPLPLERGEIIRYVADVLLLPEGLKKIGYKYGSWLYLRSASLEDCVRAYYLKSSNPPFTGADFERGSGVSSPFVKHLMVELSDMGALRHEHEGYIYSARQAFFYTRRASSRDPVVENPGQYMIICRAYAFGRPVFGLADAKEEPTIARAVYAGNPLSSAAHIDHIMKAQAKWKEPEQNTLQKKEAAVQQVAQKEQERMQRSGVPLAAFGPEFFAHLTQQDWDLTIKGAGGAYCYRADALLDRFSPPDPNLMSEVEVDGVKYWTMRAKNKP